MHNNNLSFHNSLSIIARTVIMLFRSAPKGIAALVLVNFIAGIFPVLSLYLSKCFLDSLASACENHSFNSDIIFFLFMLFLLSICTTAVTNAVLLIKSNVSGEISLFVNAQVLEKCVNLSMSLYDNETTYNKIRFTSDQTSTRCDILINTFSTTIQAIVSLCGVVGTLLVFNPLIVFFSVLASIPLFFINQYVSNFWYKLSISRVEKQRFSDVLRNLILNNDNIKELKLFASLSYIKDKIIEQQTKYFREDQAGRRRFFKIDCAQKSGNDFVVMILKLWIIISCIVQHHSLGTINLYTNALDQVQGAIFSIFTQLNIVYEQALYLQSLFDLLDMPTEDSDIGFTIDEPIRSIEFRHVFFSYPGTNSYALKDISFRLDTQHTYALIGLNGSGKTTLLKLLMKLYQPSSGEILINGYDLNTVSAKSLRKHISAIFQDFIKYPFTLEENITISDLTNAKDSQQFEVSVENTGVNEIINRLPEQQHTQLQKGWNGGIELSQGQWQKIAIARCLFKKSDVYLFDEPFSAIDAISEQNIIRKLRNCINSSIAIFITHRYSSLVLADYILVLKDGELVESGTHEELQKRGNYYSELMKAQIDPLDELSSPQKNQTSKNYNSTT